MPRSQGPAVCVHVRVCVFVCWGEGFEYTTHMRTGQAGLVYDNAAPRPSHPP